MRTQIPADVLRSIMEHAAATSPEECCGALLGRDEDGVRHIVRAIRLENVADPAERHNRYLISPHDIIAVEEDAARAGLEVVGYYHSHPGGRPVPSHIDLGRAWPVNTYLIVVPQGGGHGHARAWRLADDEAGFVEDELVEIL
ncbi:MAG TPA: M67 family metallopeptidase [Longimicrobiales bacterium]|nr:M67 family metallopeptidase [Longimicrobiales bacterium]